MLMSVFDNHEDLVDKFKIVNNSAFSKINAVNQWIHDFDFHNDFGVYPQDSCLVPEMVYPSVFNVYFGTKVVYTIFFEEKN